MKKKILFYTDTPNYGGAEIQMGLLAKYLAKSGHRVDLAIGQYAELSKKDLSVYENVSILRVCHKHDFRHYFQLKRLLKEGDYDVVHLHLWNPAAARYALWATRHLKIPVVVTEHDPFALRGGKAWIRQKSIDHVSAHIVLSSDNAHLLNKTLKIPKNKIHLVPNGIEVGLFKSAQKDHSSHLNRLVCVAELHPRKGHIYLMEAFDLLRKEGIDLHLDLVGKGPLLGDFKEKYQKDSAVSVHGWVKDSSDYIARADVLVLPSPKEAFGLVLLEAMASKVVVVACDSGGPKDIIQDGVNGFLAQPKDSVSLKEAIKNALRVKADENWLNKTYENMKNQFSAQKMAQKTDEVYDCVLKN